MKSRQEGGDSRISRLGAQLAALEQRIYENGRGKSDPKGHSGERVARSRASSQTRPSRDKTLPAPTSKRDRRSLLCTGHEVECHAEQPNQYQSGDGVADESRDYREREKTKQPVTD